MEQNNVKIQITLNHGLSEGNASCCYVWAVGHRQQQMQKGQRTNQQIEITVTW